MDEDFGILPYPASEEKGAGYIYGSRTFGGFPYVVPLTATDLDMISTIMEALACESANSVIPVLYDKVLKVKNTRDEDSARMLDMVRKNRITDLAETFWWDKVEYPYEDYLRLGKYDIASRTEKIRSKAEKDIAKETEFFLSLD